MPHPVLGKATLTPGSTKRPQGTLCRGTGSRAATEGTLSQLVKGIALVGGEADQVAEKSLRFEEAVGQREFPQDMPAVHHAHVVEGELAQTPGRSGEQRS